MVAVLSQHESRLLTSMVIKGFFFFLIGMNSLNDDLKRAVFGEGVKRSTEEVPASFLKSEQLFSKLRLIAI